MSDKHKSKRSPGRSPYFALRTVLAAVLAAVLCITFVAAQKEAGLDRSRPKITRSETGHPLTSASRAAPETVVAGYLRNRGRSDDVLSSLRVTGTNEGAYGVEHVRLEQQVDGVAVYGAYVKAAISPKGELVNIIDRLYDVKNVTPSLIDAAQALSAAMVRLYPGMPAELRASGTTGNTAKFDGGGFFYGEPTVTAVVLPLESGTFSRGWLVETWTAESNQLYHTVVDGSGRILDVESRTANDSYNVFIEDPGKGGQTIVSGPAPGDPYSPLGWLDPGTLSAINITGNNAMAYLDADGNNRPDRGGSKVSDGQFLAVWDPFSEPSTSNNRAVAVQNLFYLNNVAHDTLYKHGFDEAAGNFQTDNFGNGGSGNDPVLAEAQDGGGTDNANFATPSDGMKPRMQMYLWHPSGPTAEVVVNGQTYEAYQSVFGPSLTSNGVTNQLAVVSPPEACDPLPRRSLSNKIAIIDRGTCTFVVKVLNAQKAGAKAVLIVNNLDNGAFSPGGSDPSVKIPSAMVTLNDGTALKPLAGSTATLRKDSTTSPMLDGDLDSDIVFHEYGHGLTWRMIGGMSGPLAGAVGEGASDVNAFLNNGDDVIGEYAADNPAGIRRAPYANYTFTYGDVTGQEVHDDGEIYAAAMWRVLQYYILFGLAADDLYDDFVDGMNYTPSNPAFEDMRDGMLASVGNDPRACLIWQGFAEQGIGLGASGVVSVNSVTITESFAIPAQCQP